MTSQDVFRDFSRDQKIMAYENLGEALRALGYNPLESEVHNFFFRSGSGSYQSSFKYLGWRI